VRKISTRDCRASSGPWRRQGRAFALAVAVAVCPQVAYPQQPVRPHPHEPEGFTRFAEYDFSRLPRAAQPMPDGKAGRWYALGADRGGDRPGQDSARGRRRSGLLEIRQDPSAPASPPDVAAILYPRGFEAGRGPVNFGGWDVAGDGPGGQKSAIYLSLWIKIGGPDYENHAVGTKILFLAGGLPPSTRGQSGNQLVLFLKGTGRIATASEFRVELHQFFPKEVGAPFQVKALGQNATQRPLVRAGVWHHFEVRADINDPGVADGQFRWWIDGVLAMQYTNLIFRPRRAQAGFWNLKVNPTWGGTGGRKSRPDVILIDDIYLSGIPLAAPPSETNPIRRDRSGDRVSPGHN